MKNIQKTIVAWLAFVALSVTSFASAEIVDMQTHSSLYQWDTQCDWGTWDKVFYAWSSHHEMVDTFGKSSNESYAWLFNPQATYASVYKAFNGAIEVPTLAYYSNWKPHNVQTVVVMGTKEWATIGTNIPSDYKRSKVAAQIVYHVSRTSMMYKEWTSNTIQYLDYNNLWAGTQTYKFWVNFAWWMSTSADNECLNIHIWYCWDGIVDNWTSSYSDNINAPLNWWEECDDGAANGTASSSCTVSCTKKPEPPKVTPKCVSSYEGDLYNSNYPAALLNADKVLCNPGEVTEFVGPVEPNRTYTWKCTWSEWTTPDNCNAKELWCGDGKVQSAYWEECDPNETNPNWWGKECSPSCKLGDKKIYDLALTKTLAESNKTYKPGDSIYYRITIYNQGNYVAKNIEITDYIPYWLILDDDKWTQNGNVAKRIITSEIQPWSSVSSITIKFKIDPDFNGTEIINGAEISKDNSSDYNTEDIDSNPDNNPNDDCIVPYDHIITGNGKDYSENGKACDESTDEDDHDYVPIYFEDQPGEPTIDKELMWDKDHPYKVWELVWFKMVFKNATNKTVKHAIIKDQLPLNLEYVSSEIYGVSPVKKGLYKVWGVTVLEYSWFDLTPNQEGYVILTGKVLDEHLDNRLNNVCIYGNDQKNPDWSDKKYVCDDAEYIIWWRDIKIEKSVSKKEVALWDIIEYTIKVTGLDWEYTGFRITDKLPKGIAFYSYELNSASTTVKYNEVFSTWTTSAWVETLVWNYTFPNKFKKGDILTIKFKAKVVELYKKYSTNVACILPPGEKEQCDQVDVTPNIVLNIKKYVSNSVNGPWYDDSMTLENGKTAYFKIVVDGADDPLEKFIVKDTLNDSKLLFKNESWSLANNAFTWAIKFWTYNTWVKDDYKITPRVNAKTWSTQLSWDVYMWKWYFMSWDKFEAIFMAEKKADEKNIACVYYDKLGEEVHECDPAEVKNSTGNILTIKKYVSKNSDWKVDGDFKDADTTSAALELDTTKNEKNIIFKLVVKDAKVSLTWFVVKDSLDTSMYKLDKAGTLKLSENAYTGIMKKWTKNTTDFNYVITPKITNDKDLEWNVVMKSWSVFMEGDTLTVYFKAEKVRNDNDKNTACVYDYSGKTSYACDPAHVLRKCLTSCSSPSGGWGWWGWGWGWSNCWDGYKNGIEYCDWWNSEKVIHKGDSLFKNTNVPSTYEWSWICTKSCTLKKETSWEAPKCFNVQNGSISIMKWEMLPFYWNMAWQMWKWRQDIADRVNYVKDNFIQKCTSSSAGKIELASMNCNFKIYGPGRTVVYEISSNCTETNDWNSSKDWTNFKTYYPIIRSLIAQNRQWWLGWSYLDRDWDTKDVYETLDNYWKDYPTLLPVSSKLIIENFGKSTAKVGVKSTGLKVKVSDIKDFWEYKISLDSVDYKVCNWDWSDAVSYHWDGVDQPICEVDFAVTDHYIVQKSPYWEIKSQQLSNAVKYSELSDYKNIDWSALFENNGINKPVDYSVPANLKTTLDTFIKKYYGNSIFVKNACWWKLRKVQWKSIYFIDGTNEIDLSSCLWATDKPFTMVAKDWANIRIKGSLYTNAMIMTKWNIIFDAEWFRNENNWDYTACNGDITQYWHAWQMVKWIFYADKWFLSDHDKKNTSVSNPEWCNYGNLHIKWVAIWDLKDVVSKRRSELYTWFNDWCDSKKASTDSKCKNRRDIILNGASVLVEYNPDLWGNLPPGAEDFNKALEVYRK